MKTDGMRERRMVAVLGGSFDPVHNGHVALGGYFAKLLFPDRLRILPAGNPWQKRNLEASAPCRSRSRSTCRKSIATATPTR